MFCRVCKICLGLGVMKQWHALYVFLYSYAQAEMWYDILHGNITNIEKHSFVPWSVMLSLKDTTYISPFAVYLPSQLNGWFILGVKHHHAS